MKTFVKKYLNLLPDSIIDKGIKYRLFITKEYSDWIIKYAEDEKSFSKHILVRNCDITEALKEVLDRIFPEEQDKDIIIYKKKLGKSNGEVKLIPYIKQGIIKV